MGTNRTKKRISLFIKRLFDIVLSITGLVVLSPLFLVITVIIKLTIPGKVLFRQTRVGYRKKLFSVLKFKTMSDDPEETKRIPASGKWLRRFKLDELPQLHNVLRGDMSLIGPRPYIVAESLGLDEERYQMRPGLTGLAQVYGNRELSLKERTAYDLDYIRYFNLAQDFKILLRTTKVIVLGEKACVKHRN